MHKVVIKNADENDLELIAKAIGSLPTGLSDIKQSALNELQYDLGELDSRLQCHLAEYLDPANPRTRGSIEWWLKREIRYFYRRAYVEGRRCGNNLKPLDVEDDKVLRRLRLNEFKYLRNFLDDISQGQGVMEYRKRMRMYADALPGVFWYGFVQANRSNRRRIKWRNSPAEHCETCLPLDGRVWTPRSFMRWYKKNHILPSKGVKCKSNCKCYLEDFFL